MYGSYGSIQFATDTSKSGIIFINSEGGRVRRVCSVQVIFTTHVHAAICTDESGKSFVNIALEPIINNKNNVTHFQSNAVELSLPRYVNIIDDILAWSFLSIFDCLFSKII